MAWDSEYQRRRAQHASLRAACSSTRRGAAAEPSRAAGPITPSQRKGRRGRGLTQCGRSRALAAPPISGGRPRRLAGARGRSSGRWAEAGRSLDKSREERKSPAWWPRFWVSARPREKPEQLWSSRDCRVDTGDCVLRVIANVPSPQVATRASRGRPRSLAPARRLVVANVGKRTLRSSGMLGKFSSTSGRTAAGKNQVVGVGEGNGRRSCARCLVV